MPFTGSLPYVTIRVQGVLNSNTNLPMRSNHCIFSRYSSTVFPAGMSIYITLSHADEIIDGYIIAIDQVFTEIANALRKGNVEK